MKRYIQIVNKEGYIINRLEIAKLVRVNTEIEMIHLDQMKDGRWRLIYNSNTINDIKDIECLAIVRKG